ncbi:alpha/beta hydrolase, partial [Aeromonas veronii]|nr:alpha/beta hydrolase [Aeromonas veronii]
PNLLTKEGKENAELAPIVESMASDIGPKSYINQLTALKNREGYLETLRNIDCPTLVLTGDKDVLCPVKLHQEMAEQIQDSKLVVI